jgi:KUP system potassium uptake protein
VLSLVFWSLILVISIKYIAFVLRADNRGEGGVLALLALLQPGSARGWRAGIVLGGLFGTALLFGDGVITPAISVLSAVEGFEVATPAFQRYTVPTAIVILLALFLVQRRGSGAVGMVFGPVMVAWFLVIGLLGVIAVASEPGVLRAAWPGYAARLFILHPLACFLALGAVFLVVTGGEALYADMGHFGRRPIALGWFGLALPALMCNYLGQGALLLRDPSAAEQPFYLLAPEWSTVPLAVLATMATIIASQALISGAFSLAMQASHLGYLPRLRLQHTSVHAHGQVYIPAVNWSLMVACIGTVVFFGTSSNLAAAYGVAVTTTMLITSVLLYLVARERWGWPALGAGALIGAFLLVDVAFFAANLWKVPQGGWFPLVLGVAVFVVMTTWRSGRQIMLQRTRGRSTAVEAFLQSLHEAPPARVPGMAIYLHGDPSVVPPALLVTLELGRALPDRVVLCTLEFADEAYVPPHERPALEDLGNGVYRLRLRYGFMERPDVPDAIHRLGLTRGHERYVLGVERVIPSQQPAMAAWREWLFALLHRNASPAAVDFRIPRSEVIEIGQQVEL